MTAPATLRAPARADIVFAQRAGFVASVVAIAALAAHTPAGLFLLPALVLLLLLVGGRYPGEQLIGSRSTLRCPAARAPRSARVLRRAERRVARGGGLIAMALGGRPPPATERRR